MSGDLYNTLELERNASMEDIRRAYLKLSRVHHPDKGGNPEMFKKISKAYEVLYDERSRSIYDQTGQIPGDGDGGGPPGFGGGMPFGMNMGPGGFPGFPFDIGSMFGMFGEGRRGAARNERQQGKAPPKKTVMNLSLKDFYHGRTVDVNIQQQRFCPDCQGHGSKQMSSCAACHGQGVRRQVTQMGMMLMESHGPCDVCHGKGKQMGPPCGLCQGSKFVQKKKTIHVVIPKGSAVGDTIVLEGESSHTEQFTEPGDVVIQLDLANDTQWVREGNSLKTTVTIDIDDALCGTILTFDEHPGFPEGFHVEIPPFIQNGHILKLSNVGMPLKDGTGTGYGDVYITVHIHIPEAKRELLEKNLSMLRYMFQRESLDVVKSGKKGVIQKMGVVVNGTS